MATPTEILIEVVNVFATLDIPYVIVGSLASSARGMRRATVDADILARIPLKIIPELVDALSSLDYYIDEVAVRRAVESGKVFNAIHIDSSFKIDVYSAHDDFSRLEIDRKLPEKIRADSDTSVYIATAEDTVVAKLVWFRKGGELSDRQWFDVLGILKVQGDNLDYEYIRSWCERLDVKDLFEKALSEA